jgi:hypothetical protein
LFIQDIASHLIAPVRLDCNQVIACIVLFAAVFSVFLILITFHETVFQVKLLSQDQFSNIKFFTSKYVNSGFIARTNEANHATCGVAIEVQFIEVYLSLSLS